MRWLRYGIVVLCVGIALSVFALVIHTFWLASQGDTPLLGQKVQDLQLLVIILLALTGLFTVVFLLSPSLSERIIKRQGEETVKLIQKHLAASATDFRELKEEIRQVMCGQVKAMREVRGEIAISAIPALEGPQLTASANPMGGREYLHLSGRLRVLNKELVQIYQGLAALSIPHDLVAAKTYLNQALGLTPDPETAAEIHYDLACLLARQGEAGEAVIELQTAFMHKSQELERKLTKDTEEGGALYELTARQPYNRVLDDLLMDVSVGS